MESHNRTPLRDVTDQRAVILECSHVTRVCRQSGKAINRAGGEGSWFLVCPVSSMCRSSLGSHSSLLLHLLCYFVSDLPY